MQRWLADENFNNMIVRGLLRRRPELDVVRVQDVLPQGSPDEVVLEWAATEGRILLTHDVTTLAAIAWQRVDAGLEMPGVIEVGRAVPLAAVIDDVLLMDACSLPGEWEGSVLFLPLE